MRVVVVGVSVGAVVVVDVVVWPFRFVVESCGVFVCRFVFVVV